MPFNSTTYHVNRTRREAWENLATAREIRGRVAAGTAYDWEVPRIELFAKLALGAMRLHLSMRRVAEAEKNTKAILRGRTS